MFEATGDRGELLAGWHHAAHVRGWRIVKREESLRDPVTVLRGRLENPNRFWAGRADRIRLTMGRCKWAWDDIEIRSLDPLEVWLYNAPRSISIPED